MAFKFFGFAGYKDGSLRIMFRDSRKKITKSVPLDKTDHRNYNSNMKRTELKRLITKYGRDIL